ncbi:ribonuclease H protein [Dorcoceras hygrometricum]|uniref:Ribonuclease H protein n=1 Tax=Dorcoceras hygrometricum TaxID=472368 RepID=A0A2Z7BZJ1_9LAMI|nr:ribonuclease H protein [Dorcoceras hygrometricum]
MVSMFEALMASGLSVFLGCPAVLYEDALTELFLNGSVRDGKVVSTIRGKQVEISEELFASTFEQLMGRQIYLRFQRILYLMRGVKDMVTAGSRQAKGYAIQISLLLENVPNLELGDSSDLPSSKILTKKTVHRYIAVNDKVGVEEVADVPRMKKTPVKKAVSRKRPAAATGDEPVVKKNRTKVAKVAQISAAVKIAQEAIPLQVVEPMTVVSPKPRQKGS